MKTMENLQNAFAGESQANRKYLAFAVKAEKEGYRQIARLFRAAAAAETVHAHAHFRAMGGVKTTAENLAAAVEGEEFEFNKMYPEYIEDARAENNKAALNTFENANAVEKIHHALYLEAAGKLADGKDLTERKIYVCQVCGNTVYDNAPDICPVCGVGSDRFDEIA